MEPEKEPAIPDNTLVDEAAKYDSYFKQTMALWKKIDENRIATEVATNINTLLDDYLPRVGREILHQHIMGFYDTNSALLAQMTSLTHKQYSFISPICPTNEPAGIDEPTAAIEHRTTDTGQQLDSGD